MREGHQRIKSVVVTYEDGGTDTFHGSGHSRIERTHIGKEQPTPKTPRVNYVHISLVLDHQKEQQK